MKHEMNKLVMNDFGGTNKKATSSISIADLPVACKLDREAMNTVVGGRLVKGVEGTLDGANSVFISDWQLFTLSMEGKVTYK